jgi:hypothetical protein
MLSTICEDYAGDGRLLYGHKSPNITDKDIEQNIIDADFKYRGKEQVFYNATSVWYNFKNLIIILDDDSKVSFSLDRAIRDTKNLSELLTGSQFKMSSNFDILYNYK